MSLTVTQLADRLRGLEQDGLEAAQVREGLDALVEELSSIPLTEAIQEGHALSVRGRELAQGVGHRSAEIWFTSLIGFCDYVLSNHRQALESLLTARQGFTELGDQAGLARTLSILGGTHLSLGNYDQALIFGFESLKLIRELGDRETEGWILNGIATGYEEFGDHENARERFRASLEIFEENGDKLGQGRALTGLGSVCHAMGELDEAERYIRSSLAIFREIGNKLGESRALTDLGAVHHGRGQHAEARACHEQALKLREQIGNRQAQATSLIHLGRLAVGDNELEEAKQLLDRALEIAVEIDSRPRMFQAHEALADACAANEEFDLALAHFQAYHRVKEEVAGDQASTLLRNLQVSYEVERSANEAEISRLKNIELRRKNEQLRRLLRQVQEFGAQIVQQEKMASLAQLVAGMLHELNTPLAALTSASNVAGRAMGRIQPEVAIRSGVGRRDAAQPGPAPDKTVPDNTVPDEPEPDRALAALAQQVRIMAEATGRIRAIVGSLKSFSRLDEADEQLADLHEGIESSLDLVAAMLGPEVEVVRDYAELPRILCRPAELNQVFLNLLSNAARAIEGQGTITVSTRREGDTVVIAVTDDGVGIADERLANIFTPKLTEDGQRVKAGMGLFIGDRIVRLHGGRIEVDSQPGVGTTFRVILPFETTPGIGPIGHSGEFRTPPEIQGSAGADD